MKCTLMLSYEEICGIVGVCFFVVLFLHFHIGVLHRVRRGFQCLENGLLYAEKCSWAFC